ncbi:MAG: FtsX-like permease family protein [Planctomycetes bacterium]|nr:FtsX-like permease family protein [Planctomycetota bacterium]
MTGWFLKSSWGHIRQTPGIYALTLVGVALGVASVLAIQILSESALAASRAGANVLSGSADLLVVGPTAQLPEETLSQVLRHPGIHRAWPVRRFHVALMSRPHTYLEILGIDLLSAQGLLWEEGLPSLPDAWSQMGWCALSEAFMTEMGWSVGEGFDVSLGSMTRRLTIGAGIDFSQHLPLAGTRLAVMDLAQVQGLFDQQGKIGTIYIDVDADEDPSQIMRTLQQRLGPAVTVQAPADAQRSAEGLLSAFRLNLIVLSWIGLFVALILVWSSTQVTLTRRRSELGLFRSLGATRGQILGAILLEVSVLGVVGTCLGIPVGIGAALGQLDTLSATLTNLYFLREIETVTIPPGLIALAVVVGVGAAIGGGFLPAWEMASQDPQRLFIGASFSDKSQALATRTALAACAGMALCLILWLGVTESWKPKGFILALLSLFALALLSPILIVQVSRHLPCRDFSLSFGLKGLSGQLLTNAFAISSLGVAISLWIGISLMVHSFRTTLERWVEGTIAADVYVTSQSWGRSGGVASLDPALVEALARRAEVSGVDRLRRFWAQVEGQRRLVQGVMFDFPQAEHRFPLLQGNLDALRPALMRGDGVLISEPLARHRDLGVGDPLTLHTLQGTSVLNILGVYTDYTTEAGVVVMDLQVMEDTFGPGQVNSVALYLNPGRNPERVIDQLRSDFGQMPLEIRSSRSLRAAVLQIFDQTFAVTRLLQGICFVIAICSVSLALLVAAQDSIAEMALYRALGATRAQIFRVFLGKGLGIGAGGLTLGLVGGIALCFILVHLINRAFFGWTIHMHVPLHQLPLQCLSVLLICVLASLYPALRASADSAGDLSRETE